MNSPTNTDVQTCLDRLEQMEQEDRAVIARYKAIEQQERTDVTGHHLLKALLWVGVILALAIAWLVRG